MEFEDGEAPAKPREEYASDDCEEDVWSLSPHSSEFFEERWLRDKGASESCVKSDGRAKASSKSSSMVGDWTFLTMGFGRAATLIVETPSSSSSSSLSRSDG